MKKKQKLLEKEKSSLYTPVNYHAVNVKQTVLIPAVADVSVKTICCSAQSSLDNSYYVQLQFQCF